MTSTTSPRTIAIINSSEDVVNLLREFFEHEGFRTAIAHAPDIKSGEQDFLAFLAEHDPAVVIYDISPPYDQNWTFFRLIQNLKAMERRHIVVTTTNLQALETGAVELIGKPYDLDAILQAVQRGLRRRTSRRQKAAAAGT
jgi:DNA-binding response OmpR family regulator